MGLTPQKRKQSRSRHGGVFRKLRSQLNGSFPFSPPSPMLHFGRIHASLSNCQIHCYLLDLPGRSIWIGLFDKSPIQETSCVEIAQVERTGGTICSGHICKKVYAVQNWMEKAQHGLYVYRKQKRSLEYQLYLQTHTGQNLGSPLSSGIYSLLNKVHVSILTAALKPGLGY